MWKYISSIGVNEHQEKSIIRSVQLINRLIFITSLIAVIYIPLLFWLKAYWMGIQLSFLTTLILAFLFTSEKIKINYTVPTVAFMMMYHMTFVSIVIQNSQLELYIILITLIQFAVVKNRFLSFSIFFLGIFSYFISLYFQENFESAVIMNLFQRITMIGLNSLGIFIGGLYLIFQVTDSNTKYQIEILKERKRVLDQNTQINSQVKIIEAAHKEITDSINYSKRIQSAILPSPSRIKSILKDSFVLYKPKDIVAGDFYWVDESTNPSFFAVADCTGHGVPGAMMSVICTNALNRSLKEFNLTKPSQILDKTRALVISDLGKSEDNIKDGMDIALCSLSGNILNYSGANIKLYLIRNHTIIEYKPNKQPIGKYINEKSPFSNHSIELLDGDTIYLITDGFVDQFGGPKLKKFKTPALKKALLAIQSESMDKQKETLNSTFENWKAHLEQIDDVCVMGVKFNKQ